MHRLLTMVTTLAVVSTQLDAKIVEECYRGDGSDYMGTVSRTRGGIECQRWDTDSPHNKHGHASTPSHFPDGRLPENYCRKVRGDKDPIWCYTTDPSKRWDTCDIPECTTEPSKDNNCYTGRPDSYRGTVHHTVDGLECQRWDSQYPHTHMYNKTSYFTDGELPQNYCRTFVGKSHQPVCFTTDPNKRWDLCDVKQCD